MGKSDDLMVQINEKGGSLLEKSGQWSVISNQKIKSEKTDHLVPAGALAEYPARC